ncbi:hypothetical protein FHR75_004416 [Kineococcus radiotolerans]|uniref:Uncharacterized protein n=1 Tax=Kineococcus radiotolerans TaxID=131568 RepID=A0A7W4XZ06_KINRA|nr:hypothetical protein [Kineococcus radiotolerans]MBB2903573.1 hypothetical protein [Kineococcus radiotolerans]
MRTWSFAVGRDAYTLEQATVRHLRDQLHLPPGYTRAQLGVDGATETVAAADMSVAAFCVLIDQLRSRLQLTTLDERLSLEPDGQTRQVPE